MYGVDNRFTIKFFTHMVNDRLLFISTERL